MCTDNHVCFGRIHGSQLREGANAGQHTPTLSLPSSHHCLDGEVYRGNRHYNVCERTYMCTYNVMSQLSGWKRAHMGTENHVRFGRIHGSQLREGANAGQHTPTLSLPPSHHCLNGEVYRGHRHYKCAYVHVYRKL
jgi:hypothetical protein